MAKQSLDEWLKEAEARFGPDEGKIAFRCPACGHIQTLKDFKDHGIDPNLAYQECIGRHVKGVGCDWTAYGLLRSSNIVVTEDGKEVHVFAFADPLSH